MPTFTVTSPSGRDYTIDAASIDHANDYVARRFYSGFEAAGNVLDEEDAKLMGPFGPYDPKKQKEQQAQEQQQHQQYLSDVLSDDAPAPSNAIVPQAPTDLFSPFQQSNVLRPQQTTPRPSPQHAFSPPPQVSMADRLRYASALRLARLRAGRSPLPVDFYRSLRGFK